MFRRKNHRPLLAAGLVLAGLTGAVILLAITNTSPALATGAQAALAGYRSTFDAAEGSEMWCVRIEGGLSFARHVLLHDDRDGWTVIPVFGFDRHIYQEVGGTNW